MKLTFLIVILVIISLTESAAKNKKKLKQIEKGAKSKSTIQNKSRFGGDMLGVAPPQKGAMRKAAVGSRTRWPDGVVTYAFAAKTFNAFEIEDIETAMKDMTDATGQCIKFKKRTNEKDYIKIIKGEGCYSYVGKIGGSQDLSIGIGCHYFGTIKHELMHALGFYHEHMRSDRDHYIIIKKKNIQRGMEDQFEKLPTYYNHLYEDFDKESIMIYSSKAFSKNGRNTMESKDGVPLTEPYNKDDLTQLDISSVKKMYKCS